MKENPVPPDQVRWDRSLLLLREHYLDDLRRELSRAAAKPASPLEQKYGDFFAACMDVEELQKRGLEPLKPALERIAALNDTKGIAALIGELAAAGTPVPLFRLNVEPDPRDSTKPILSISPGGARLLERETYGGATSEKMLDRYEGHIVRVLLLTGERSRAALTQAMSQAVAVRAIEVALAHASRTNAESADHVLNLADVQKLAPDFDFSAYFSRVTTRPIDTLHVANPDYLKAVNELLGSVPVDAWKAYFRAYILDAQAQALAKASRDEDHAFWDAEVGIQGEPAPRWKQCAALTDQAFGDAFAQEWVKRNFPPVAKAGTEQLVEALKKALGEEIQSLPWMSEETKKSAEGKLAAIRNRIGSPQKWRDYSGLTVDRHDFLGDLHRSTLFERTYMLSKLERPVDPEEWDMAATALKARYDRSLNSLTIPAAMVQPPFFDRSADPAVNFGGLGVLAAQQLIEGFDAIGSKYDERGNVRDWWSPQDRKDYGAAMSCEVAQIGQAVPQSDDAPRPVNNFAVADSTAFDGGLRIAFRALMEALVAQGKSADNKSDGYTQNQRFFLSFAQSSCENQTFLTAHQSQAANPYSIGHVRVNGVVQNFEEFGKAFQCTKGKPLYPEKSCRIW
jgi:putative endopeptidase